MSICPPRFVSFLALGLTFGLTVPQEAASQHVDRLVRRAGDAASRELERKIEELARNGVRCVFDDLDCIERARADGKTPVMTTRDGTLMTDDDGVPVTDPKVAAAKAGTAASAGAAEGGRPGEGAWANYDFIPGERVLFADDFGRDNVGDFPRRWSLTEGNWEVVEWQGDRYLRATSNGAVGLALPETLPERFTVEFPVSVQHGNAYLRVSTSAVYNGDRSYAGSLPTLEYTVAGIRAHKNQGPTVRTPRQQGVNGKALVTFRIMADGSYMKVYVNEQRVANVPNAVFPRTNTLFLSVSSASDRAPIMVGPVRVAAGGRDLYDALARDGRVATQGILFAVGSDVIRPESTPTLKQIGEMLGEHGDLRLSIEGHTDSDGETAYNQELSDRRAAAVKAYLVGEYGIDASRLESVGFGEGKPVASNDTPEGKQQNRRVELVKLGG